jgi:transcription elongation factor Elf1
MNYFSFNPFGSRSLIVKFECSNCGHNVESEDIYIPEPDYSADTARDSQVDEEGSAICDNCEKEFEIAIYVTYAGGDGYINGLPEEYDIEVIEEPYDEEPYEAIFSNTFFFNTFNTEIEKLKELNKIVIKNSSVDKTLRRQIYIGIISSMETYLSDAFINTTLNSESFIRNFVATFKDFDNMIIKLNNLFDNYDKIETICKKAMIGVIYHNLNKVKGMYKDTLNVDLGNIAIPSRAVSIRHDLVHRNGKTKEGKEVNIDIDVINQLIANIETFIEEIDEQIRALENSALLN